MAIEREHLDSMIAWARSRIRYCEQVQRDLNDQITEAEIRAEKRALTSVLGQLGELA